MQIHLPQKKRYSFPLSGDDAHLPQSVYMRENRPVSVIHCADERSLFTSPGLLPMDLPVSQELRVVHRRVARR